MSGTQPNMGDFLNLGSDDLNDMNVNDFNFDFAAVLGEMNQVCSLATFAAIHC